MGAMSAPAINPPARPAPGHLRATLVIGLPLVGSHLAQFALHVTNTVMLGWYGVLPLAAGVLGASTFFIVFILGSGIAKAVLPLVAAALGQGDEAQVRRDTRMGLWLSTLFGAAIYPLFLWSEPILLGLGQGTEVSALSADYLRIAGLGMVPALLVMVLRSYLAALGRTQVVLWVTVAAVAVNAVLNWGLIFGNWGWPELGVRGAAIVTVTVQILSLVILALYAAALPELRRFQLFQRFWRPDWPAMGRVFRLGWPIGLTGLAEGGLFEASALMMGWIGTMELAAHGIALEITAVCFMVHVGLSNAVTVRAGRFHGAGDVAGVRAAARTGIAVSLVFALVTVAVYLAFPETLIRLFLSDDNPEAGRIVAFGSLLLAAAALFQLADATQAMGLGMLQGVQDTKVPMWIAAFSYWVVGVPTSYVLAFPMGFGGPGLWLGLAAGLTLAAVLLMLRFWLRVR